MSIKTRTPWQRWAYRASGLILIAPIWYFYVSMNPEFPPAWPEQQVGPFTATPTPGDAEPPYLHDENYYKDFSVRFCDGCVERIRLAYLSVGAAPAALPAELDGILHGDRYLQHVHAPYPEALGPDDRLWFTVQEWNGRVHHAAWPLTNVTQPGPHAGREDIEVR